MNYRTRLDKQWAKGPGKIDWVAYEQFIDDVMHDDSEADWRKIRLCKEALDAWTRRGHFPTEEYA